MARTKFPVEVLTPEGEVFNDEVEMVSTRTATGSIGMLANHAPLMAILEPTELRLYKSESDVVELRPGRGLPPGGGQHARSCWWRRRIAPDDIDRSDIERRLKEARRRWSGAEEGSEERARCERNVRRYEAFLEVAGGERSQHTSRDAAQRCARCAGPGPRRAGPRGPARAACPLDQVDQAPGELAGRAGCRRCSDSSASASSSGRWRR